MKAFIFKLLWKAVFSAMPFLTDMTIILSLETLYEICGKQPLWLWTVEDIIFQVYNLWYK